MSKKNPSRTGMVLAIVHTACTFAGPSVVRGQSLELVGKELSYPHHLENGSEQHLSPASLVAWGRRIFTAKWTAQEGGGRPLSKGTGAPLADPRAPLVFPRNFNRVSGPDANSCAGCHNDPIIGAGGDRATNVFVLGQRFDFVTMDRTDGMPTRGAVNEVGASVTLSSIANERKTIGMNGSGYIDMLGRQMTAELRAIREEIMPGGQRELVATGVSFGTLARRPDGSWDTSQVNGLPQSSIASADADTPPSLTIQPFHQSGANVSIRQFTVNALTHHHGVQPEERFGSGSDPDGDGFVNELTRADVTALTIFQATLGVPRQVMPRDSRLRQIVRSGASLFSRVGCATCHIPALPLAARNTIYVEPNPYNPPGNLRPGEAPEVRIDLSSDELPRPRLPLDEDGVVMVPAYTDMKLHDITSGPADPNREPLDQAQPAGTPGFLGGGGKFLTARLWSVGNQAPYMHHGNIMTMREAILQHAGEALPSRRSFEALLPAERDAVIEFLKTLRVVPDSPMRAHQQLIEGEES